MESINKFFYKTFYTLLLSRSLSDRAKKKVELYKSEFKPIFLGALYSLFVLFTISLAALNFVKSDFATWFGVLITITGVFAGAFIQQVVTLLITPPRDVMHPVEGMALLDQFSIILHDFNTKLNTEVDFRAVADTENAEVWLLQNSPILMSLDECNVLISGDVGDGIESQSSFFEGLDAVFRRREKFARHLITLDAAADTSDGPAPWLRFVRRFSHYLASQRHMSERGERKVGVSDPLSATNAIDEDVRSASTRIREGILKSVQNLSSKRHICDHWYQATTDALQLQGIAIRVPGARYFRAAVSFYGDEFLRSNSFIGDFGEGQKVVERSSTNRGFITHEPDVVDWVIQGLIRPYLSKNKQDGFDLESHSSGVEEKMKEVWSTRKSETYLYPSLSGRISRDWELNVCSNEKGLRIPFDYLVPAGSGLENRIFHTMPGVFHPVIGESALWATEQLCLPGSTKGKAMVLDLGCGTGVQGIAALYLGARCVQFVDHNPLALLCAAANFVDRSDDWRKSAIFTHADVDNVRSETFDDYVESLYKYIENLKEEGLRLRYLDNRQELDELIEKIRASENIKYEGQFSENYDLILAEPPFVDGAADLHAPIGYALYDPFFDVCRRSVDFSRIHLRRKCGEKEGGFLCFSFSSLEDETGLERYFNSPDNLLEAKSMLRILRKSAYHRNGRYWKHYLLCH